MLSIENYSLDKRKTDGIFYTPEFLANYLTKKVLQYSDKQKKLANILDPACGDGMLLRSFLKEISKDKNASIPKLVGIDKDSDALLNSKIKIKQLQNESLNLKFINTDALFPFSDLSAEIGWKNLKSSLKCESGFNIILSNPPWGSNINGYSLSQLETNFTLAKGQFDVFDLFFETILNNLSNMGLYGLILPDSMFSQEQTKFRELMVSKTTIHLIARLGEKIFPEINRACVIVVGENKKPSLNHQVDCFRLSSDFKKKVIMKEISLEEVESEFSHKVLQTRFLKNKNFQFDIDLRLEEQNLYSKIKNNSVLVNEYLFSKRGAELSKKGVVCQCNHCNNWFPYPKSKNPTCKNCNSIIDLSSIKTEKIINSKKTPKSVKLKVGEDLYRYTSISKSFIDITKKGINYKNNDFYLGKKILIRKTGIGITASIDYENFMTNQVVYILKLKKEYETLLSLEFILAFLNSRVMTYYLIKKYGENEWRTHPYLTQTALMNLPLPNIDFKDLNTRNTIDKITKIISSELNNSIEKNISKRVDLVIERTVAKYYNLDKTDYQTIFKTLDSSEKLIPIKRLLNCSVEEVFKVDGI